MKQRFTAFNRLILCGYLMGFLSACATSTSTIDRSVPEMRRIQSRQYRAAPNIVYRAVLTVLQDRSFIPETAESESGLLVATRRSNRQLHTEEQPDEKSFNFWPLVIVGVAVAAIIAVIMMSKDDDEDKEDDGKSRKNKRKSRHHGRSDNVWIIHGSDDKPAGAAYYLYQVTVMVTPQNSEITHVRLSGDWNRYQGETVMEVGDLESESFYRDFYKAVDKTVRQLKRVSP